MSPGRSFNDTSALLARSARQMFRAVSRGDTDAAWRWTMIVEHQLLIMHKLADIDPCDRRLRRYWPALAAMRRLVFAREMSGTASAGEPGSRSKDAAGPSG